MWITRLHGPARSAEMEAGFRRWLAERPENAREFEGLTEVWDLTSGALPRGIPRLERWEHSQESQELQALRALQRIRGDSGAARARPEHRAGSHARTQSRIWAIAAIWLVAVGTLSFGAYRYWVDPTYVTELGERRVVRLSDGTRLFLNSDTRLRISYRQGERRVRLERGEALFDVARDVHRPFMVTAGSHQVRALGTSFVVRFESDRTAVTLIEGKVAVFVNSTSSIPEPVELSLSNDARARAEGPVVLAAGERVTLTEEGPPRLDEPPIESVVAWQRGEVMLDDTLLSAAVAEMNRYDRLEIVIDDVGVADLIVSGVYHTGDNLGFAESVAKMYRLRVIRQGESIHLRPR